MLFNPDTKKQSMEACLFYRHELKKYSQLTLNSTNVQSAASQKHLGFILDSKLDFYDNIDNKTLKCN